MNGHGGVMQTFLFPNQFGNEPFVRLSDVKRFLDEVAQINQQIVNDLKAEVIVLKSQLQVIKAMKAEK